MVLAGQHRFLNRWAEGQRGTGKNLDFFPIRTILEAPKDLLRHAAPVQEPVLPAVLLTLRVRQVRPVFSLTRSVRSTIC